jgi:4-amino-4-deoxy-L-arabinose transferase-like glycosyltransferase
MPAMVSLASIRRWWRRPTAPLLAVATVKLAVHLATNGIYGFQRDEMYYIISGQHPALGYVDYPPLAPMLARINTSLFGISPWTLRLFPALVGAMLVLLTGLCAREMGGGRVTTTIAGLLALLSPLLLGANWLFQTVTFDLLTWLIAIYLMLRILRTRDRRLFLLLGVDLGVGLETKLTILALCVGVAVAVVASRELRPFLRTRYAWIGLGIAVALALPNLMWQIANGFPTLTYIRNHGADIAQNGGIAKFVEDFVLYLGPFALPLFVVGIVFLLRDHHLRPMGVLTLTAIALLLPEGKAYYPAPTILLGLAAGCVAISRIATERRRRWATRAVIAGAVVQIAVLLPIALPVIPQSALHATRLDALRTDFADTVGWPQLAAQVGAVYDALPAPQRAAAGILAGNYGEAGAIDIYGRRLPQALSPELTFWYWKPSHVSATTFVTVGFAPSDLHVLCGTVARAGTVTMPDSVSNQEQGTPILVCSNLREPLDAAWNALRNFT